MKLRHVTGALLALSAAALLTYAITPASAGPIVQSGPRLFVAGGGGAGKVDGDSATVVITGSGSNTTPYEFFGGKNGNIDAGTNLTRASKSGWSGAASIAPMYDNTQTYSRSKSLGFDARYTKAVNFSNSGAFAWGFDMGAAVSEYSFEGNVFFGINSSANLLDSQWKVHRLATIDDIQDSFCIYYTAHWKSGGVNGNGDFLTYPLGGLQESNSGTHTSGTSGFGLGVVSYQHSERFPDVYPANNSGIWYRYKFWGKPGTGTNTDDGQWTMDMWRLDTGAKVMTNYDINVRTYTSASRGRWFELQNYHGNAAPQPVTPGTADGTTTFEEPGDGYAFWDDVWLSFGPGARMRLVCTNASTWAASTKWWNQPYTSWTSGTIAFTFNDPLGQCTHFYAVDSTDTVVNTSGVAKSALTLLTPANDDVFRFDRAELARAA